MKQKTALQEAIDVLNKAEVTHASISDIMGILKTFLPKEREQIEEAYLTGHSAGQVISNQTPSEYYESTYETP